MLYWELAAQIATALAVIVAIAGLIWQARVNHHERKYQNSQFRLSSAMQAYEEASNLLKDGNNDRVTWIAAARAVERGQRIARRISFEEHRDLYEVLLDRFRRIFGDYLGYNNPERNASFFYGAPTSIAINDAARSATRAVDGRPALLNIPEPALRILFQFAQFPEDYEDSISSDVRFPDEDVDAATMRIMWPGIVDYLRHAREYRSINGELHKIRR